MGKRDKQRRKSARATVKAVYKEIPRVACKGLCHDSCGSIPVTLAELPIFKKALSGPLQTTFPLGTDGDMPQGLLVCGKDTLTCPALTEDLRCSIHENRPLICRLYGVVDQEKMICPHGCVPERWVKHDEVQGWYSRLEAVTRGKE